MRSLWSPLLLLESLAGLIDVDELAEVLDVGEHGVLLHGQVVLADEEPHLYSTVLYYISAIDLT